MRGSTRKALETVAGLLNEDAIAEDRMAQLMTSLSEAKAQPIVVDTHPFAEAIDRMGQRFEEMRVAMDAPRVKDVQRDELGRPIRIVESRLQ